MPAPNTPDRTRRRPTLMVAIGALLLIASAVATLVAGPLPADAHGGATFPGSRTYFCRIDGTSSSGDIEPKNPACAEAVAIGGKQPLWDWFGVLRADGAGRTRGYIPDGQLCSGGEGKYAGYDLARADWPYTRLTSGSTITFRYNAWAAHPGEFRMYVTKDGFDPTKPLRWDDLEAEPFSTYAQTQPNGTDAQNNTPDYQWQAALPAKSGRHIIYSVWERSDSAETFYNCSDVMFDGGNGEVIGLGAGAVPISAPTAAEMGTPEPVAASIGQPDTGDAIPPAQPGNDGAQPGAAPEQDVVPEPTGDAEPAMTEPMDDAEPAMTEPVPSGTDRIAGGAQLPVAATVATDATQDAALGPAPEPGGGPGWFAMVFVAMLALALGAVSATAVVLLFQKRELQDRLEQAAGRSA